MLLEHPEPRVISSESLASWNPAKMPSHRLMKGQHVMLEPLDAQKHARALYDASHGDDKSFIWKYMKQGPWSSFEDYEQMLQQQSMRHNEFFFAIRSLKTNRICGQIGYLGIDPLNGCIEIGRLWFDHTLRKTQGSTEAFYLMMRYAMSELNYRRLQWKCNANNKNSIRAAKRLGFKFEGILYNHLIVKGHNRDTAYFSILDKEWPACDAIISRNIVKLSERAEC